MKNLLFFFLFAFSTSIVSAQEITVASIIDTKSNAEWLESSVLGDKPIIALNDLDKREISKITKRLKVGRTLSQIGLVLSPAFFYSSPINALQGAFTRMPAHSRLNNFIEYKYPGNNTIDNKHSDFNLNLLLEAKRNLDQAQRNSNVAIILNILQNGYAVYLFSTVEGWDVLLPIFIVGFTVPLTNTIFTGINLGRLNKSIRALEQVR
jgi:hypothetical protein